MLVVVPLIVFLHVVAARPDGLPWPDACETMSPGNGIPPQTTPCPFKLNIDDTETTSDGCIYLTIKGPEPEEFAGFMVQARNESGIAVGMFLEADDVKLQDCFGAAENTAITINYLPKDQVVMRWKPSGFVGNVNIYATIARDYMEQMYWLMEKTPTIKVVKGEYG